MNDIKSSASFSSIGIIGAGQMGTGIASFFLDHNLPVSLYDPDERALNKARDKLLFRYTQKDNPQQYEGLLTIAPVLDVLVKNQLIIEAIYENEEAKKKLYHQLSTILHPESVLASNTSSLSITVLASHYHYPHNFLGVHFFNPAYRLPLVEVITHSHASAETVHRVCEFLEKLGKTPIRCKDTSGFIVNRLLIPLINSAARLVDEGTACIEDIDQAMKYGANLPMGPLALADFIGIDVVISILNSLQANNIPGDVIPANSLLSRQADGDLGKKTGRGFYNYQAAGAGTGAVNIA